MKFRPWVEPIQRWLVWLLQNLWMRWLMRWGHAAKGLLYGLIGLIVLDSLAHHESEIEGSQGVLMALGSSFLGSGILAFLSVGLLGYALWRFLQATLDPGHTDDRSLRRLVKRCGYGVSCLTYCGVAYTAGQLAIGLAVDTDDTVEDAASILFERAIGPWIMLGIGIGTVAVGLTYLYGAYSGSYITEFLTDLYPRVRRWSKRIGQVGIAARGLGFILIGLYLIKSAYFVSENSAGGLGKVFSQLHTEPWGDVGLVAIAIGFIAYAVYMNIAAWYREFPGVKSRNQTQTMPFS